MVAIGRRYHYHALDRGQITALNIIKQLILPSMVVCVIPAWIVARSFKGKKIAQSQLLSVQWKKKKMAVLFCSPEWAF